jgi:hypothetical protein
VKLATDLGLRFITGGLMKRVMFLFAALVALAALGIREVHPTATPSNRDGLKTSLESQIEALKARGEYRADLWSAFFTSRASASRTRTHLDQGGENIGDAIPIPTLPYSDIGLTNGYIDDYYEPCDRPGPGGSPDVVYSYFASQNEMVDITLCMASYFDTKLYIYENVYTPGNPYACDDDYCPGLLSQLNSVIFSSGNTYYIVVDGWGGEEGDYSIDIFPHQQVEPCPCPLVEVEPNDTLPPIQTIGIGEELCGAISTPIDVDFIGLSLFSATAVKVTLEGNAGRLPCPGGLGLHPCAQILSEDGEVIANIGDTTNQATYWTSDFKLGPFHYVVKIAGANNTVGPWILRVDSIPTPTMAPPEPQATIRADSEGACLYWNGSYVPGEKVIVERSTDMQTWSPYDSIPAGVCSLSVPTSPGSRAFFRLKASGTRPKDPFIGSVLTLSEPGDSLYAEDTEVGYYQVDAIEWGANADNEVGIARLRAYGVGTSSGEWIDQDNRDLFSQGVLTPITDFTGRMMNIFGRDVFVQHMAFVKDSATQKVRIVDGRGFNPSGDSAMFFHDSPVNLTPNLGVSANWSGFFWWDWCPDQCCWLTFVAFCRSTGLGWQPACAGWQCAGDPSCWLGCPCQPVGAPPPCLPNCAPCELVPDPRFPLMRWCMCASQTPPPRPPRCFFQIFVRCKYRDCIEPWCVCGGAPPCPVYRNWTPVLHVNRAMRARCKRDCTL